MADTRIQLLIQLKDEATGRLKAMGGQLNTFRSSVERSASASRSFAVGLTAVGAAVGGLGFAAIKAAADAEQSEIAFTTMLGSAEKADLFIRDLVDFAKRTPFELKGLEESSKKLLAFGVQTQNIIPDLRSLGNIAAGVGQEKLPFLINAFGQVRAKGRLMGQELLQFTEAGVPLAEELAKSFGKTTAQIQDMISKGEVGFEDVRDALEGLSGESGRFNNLMDKQADSLNGMISNLRDAWDIFLRGEGQQLIEWAKQFTQVMINFVSNTLPQVITKIKEVTDFFAKHKEALIIVAGAIIGALVPAIWAATVAFGAMAVSLAPFIIGGAVIGGIVAGVLWLVKNWDLAKQKAVDVFLAIKDTIMNALGAVADFFRTWAEGYLLIATTLFAALLGVFGLNIGQVKELWENLWGSISSILQTGATAVKGKVSSFWSALSGLWGSASEKLSNGWSNMWNGFSDIVTKIWDGIVNVVKTKVNFVIEGINVLIRAFNQLASMGGVGGSGVFTIPEVPKLAEGGIVTKPTLALIGEAGAEAVVPLNGRHGGFGGGINITMESPVFLDDLAADRFGEALMGTLRGQLRV